MTNPITTGQSPQCSICLNYIEENARRLETVCQHIFHRCCLYPWLTANESGHCPNCRTVTAISFRTLFEEDYTVISACHAELTSKFQDFNNRVIDLEIASDETEVNLRLLANHEELQSTLKSLVADCSQVKLEIVHASHKLHRMNTIIPYPRDRLVQLENLNLDPQLIGRIVQIQRDIVSEYLPVQAAVEEAQSEIKMIAQRLEIEFPELERRLSEINAQIVN